MKKMIPLVILLILILLFGCTSTNPATDINVNNNATLDQTIIDSQVILPNIEKVEVIHFHSTSQCYSCITVGDYAEKTINKYFSDELKSGKLTFAHINIDLPENQELVNKYGVTGSSLWIGTYSETGFHKEENVTVWYKIDNQTDYEEYLAELLTKKLQGILK